MQRPQCAGVFALAAVVRSRALIPRVGLVHLMFPACTARYGLELGRLERIASRDERHANGSQQVVAFGIPKRLPQLQCAETSIAALSASREC